MVRGKCHGVKLDNLCTCGNRLLSSFWSAPPPPVNASVVQQIAANDAKLQELSLGDAATKYFLDVTEMVDALQQNQVIESVRIDRDFLPSLLGQPEKKAAVVTAIGKLPALKSLRIMSGPVHAVVLGKALQDAAQLVTLELVRSLCRSPATRCGPCSVFGCHQLHSLTL